MELWEPPAGFDDPLAALAACHRRIEKQMATLARLQKHIGRNGMDGEARTATAGVLRYFVEAAPHHHADEEADLFPKILRTAEGSADRARAFELVAHLLVDHRDMEQVWAQVRQTLEGLQAGEVTTLDAPLCKDFARIYASHIEREEGQLFPLAARLLQPADIVSLGNAMAARRGLPPPFPAASGQGTTG